jgi:hypothetical protein
VRTCSHCGRENPDGARFCANCGSALRDATGSAREERRVVTVLYADLAGDLSGAADLFDEIGSAGDEATARAKEAEGLIAAGRRPEAEPFLSRALDLYRSMGATAFIRDAERLLAAPA